MHTHQLNALQVLVLDGAIRHELHCRAGTVWASFAGEDIVLCAGSRWLQPRRSAERLLIQAVNGAATLDCRPLAKIHWQGWLRLGRLSSGRRYGL
jgi:hypothetical protein